jgi:hypothetical protein
MKSAYLRYRLLSLVGMNGHEVGRSLEIVGLRVNAKFC